MVGILSPSINVLLLDLKQGALEAIAGGGVTGKLKMSLYFLKINLNKYCWEKV